VRRGALRFNEPIFSFIMRWELYPNLAPLAK